MNSILQTQQQKLLPYFPVDNARVINTKKVKISKKKKNEHVWYTLEYFTVDNARVIYWKIW
jgi:hypothetical protein